MLGYLVQTLVMEVCPSLPSNPARFFKHVLMDRINVPTLPTWNLGGILLPPHANVFPSRGSTTCVLFGQRCSN